MGKKVLVTGGTGMIGIKLINLLVKKGYEVKVVSMDSGDNLPNDVEFEKADLTEFSTCKRLCKNKDMIYHLAGIKGSPQSSVEKPARFLVPMLQFNTNMMEAARLADVEWFLYTSSVGVYHPAEVFKEDDVWKTFPSEFDWHPGWAKRMGELQAEAYQIQYGWDRISIVRPANVYGEYDNFGEHSMVIPSLIKKAFENPELEVWGDGSPIRDLIYSEDVARGMIHMVENAVTEPVNLGSGTGVTIKEVAEIIAKYFSKEIVWDKTKPMGDMKRLMSMERANSNGFYPQTSFEDGIMKTIKWYLETIVKGN